MTRVRIRQGAASRQLVETTPISNFLALDDAPRVSIDVALTGRYGLCSVDAILENPNAVRMHTKRKVKKLGRSMERVGTLAPPVVDETYTLLAGHARIAAAKDNGVKTIPVVQIFGLTEPQKRAYLLSDNRLAEDAGLNREKLAAQLPNLEVLFADTGLELTDTGFEVAELDELVSDMDEAPLDEDDALDAGLYDEPCVFVAGDNFRLGDHRLLVGDARDAAALGELMQGDLAACAILDVPFNVAANAMGGRGRHRHPNFLNAFGEMKRPEYLSFLVSSFKAAADQCRPGAIVYPFSDSHHVRDMIEAGEKVFETFLTLVVWNKTNAGQGGLYRNQHELIGVFRVGGEPHMDNVQKGQFGRNRSTVWTYAGANGFRRGRMDDLACHPTVKPTALIADALKDVTKRGDIVLDSFVGSGTTILAAEKTGRRARGIELDPHYAQMAARRWEKVTGRDAVHAASGLTLDELAQQRKKVPENVEEAPAHVHAPRARHRTRSST